MWRNDIIHEVTLESGIHGYLVWAAKGAAAEGLFAAAR
jgi:hypothetical protein